LGSDINVPSNVQELLKNEKWLAWIRSFRTFWLATNDDFPDLKELQQITQKYYSLAIVEISR
jgi:hypothetical protein